VNIKRALLMSGACGILATAVSTALARIPQAPDMSNARLMFTVTP
jgi:hypothetical protein